MTPMNEATDKAYYEGWHDGTAYGWQGCVEENNLYNRYNN